MIEMYCFGNPTTSLMELAIFRFELLFGYYGELKVTSKMHLGTLTPFGPYWGVEMTVFEPSFPYLWPV